MNVIHGIQQLIYDRIVKIPIIASSIGESGKIPVHLWRGSNITNELEAGLKRVGFGVIVRPGSFTQIDRDTWLANMRVEIQLNDQFNHSDWGKNTGGWDVAWKIAEEIHNYRPEGSTSVFYNLAINSEPSEQRFIEKLVVTANIQIKTP